MIGLGDAGGAFQPADLAAGILGVVTLDMLVGGAEIDRPVVRRCDPQRGAAAISAGAVDVILVAQDIVDIAAFLHAIADDAQRHLLGHDRQVEDGRQVAARIAMLGCRHAGRDLAAKLGEIGGVGDDADDAAERAGAVERALWPFQHLDPADVIEAQVGIGRGIVEAHVAQILTGRRLGRPGNAGIGYGADEQLVAAGTGMGGTQTCDARE